MDEKLEKIRDFLRYHSDYTVEINPFGIYGCIIIRLCKGKYTIFIDGGMHFERRLDRLLIYLEKLQSEGEQ